VRRLHSSGRTAISLVSRAHYRGTWPVIYGHATDVFLTRRVHVDMVDMRRTSKK